MKIFTAIPVKALPSVYVPGVLYIENGSELSNICQKLNYALQKANEADADWLCFHHSDLTINTPELVEAQLELAYRNGARVCGVIGSLLLSDTRWWANNRPINTHGAIMQGYKDGSVKPMIDSAGFNPNMAVVDGCVLWIHKDMFGERVNDYGMHLYDDDICLRALSHDYKVAVIDVRCTHMSEGGYDAGEYQKSQQKFMNYWKKRVDFAVLPGHSKFKGDENDSSK